MKVLPHLRPESIFGLLYLFLGEEMANFLFGKKFCSRILRVEAFDRYSRVGPLNLPAEEAIGRGQSFKKVERRFLFRCQLGAG